MLTCCYLMTVCFLPAVWLLLTIFSDISTSILIIIIFFVTKIIAETAKCSIQRISAMIAPSSLYCFINLEENKMVVGSNAILDLVSFLSFPSPNMRSMNITTPWIVDLWNPFFHSLSLDILMTCSDCTDSRTGEGE